MWWEVARFFLIAVAALAIPCSAFGIYVYRCIANDDRRRALDQDRETEMRLRAHLVAP